MIRQEPPLGLPIQFTTLGSVRLSGANCMARNACMDLQLRRKRKRVRPKAHHKRGEMAPAKPEHIA